MLQAKPYILARQSIPVLYQLQISAAAAAKHPPEDTGRLKIY